MFDFFEIPCPWCGEPMALELEAQDWGTLVQDCDVCCHACEISLRRDE